MEELKNFQKINKIDTQSIFLNWIIEKILWKWKECKNWSIHKIEGKQEKFSKFHSPFGHFLINFSHFFHFFQQKIEWTPWKRNILHHGQLFRFFLYFRSQNCEFSYSLSTRSKYMDGIFLLNKNHLSPMIDKK